MDERLYLEAVRRREQIQRLLHDLQEEMKALDYIIRVYQGSTATQTMSENSASGGPASSGQTPSSGSRPRNPIPPRQLADLARDEILAHKRPMTRGQLLTALENKGVVLVAKDPAKNLGTVLWRFRDEFENIPGRGYWPKDVPLDGRLL